MKRKLRFYKRKLQALENMFAYDLIRIACVLKVKAKPSMRSVVAICLLLLYFAFFSYF
jgi:hypothetical protein